MASSCAFDPLAYKTNAMLENTCQHTECIKSHVLGTMNCTDVPFDMLDTLANVNTYMNSFESQAKTSYEQAKQLFLAKGSVNQPLSKTIQQQVTVAEPFTQKPKFAYILTLIGFVLWLLGFFIHLWYAAYFTPALQDSPSIVLHSNGRRS
jgi:hypothetical protein